MPGIKRTGADSKKSLKKRAKRTGWSVVKGPSWAINNGALTPSAKGFPSSVRTTMCYREQHVSLNPGIGGVPASHVFAANGLYDPNISGTGHQPVGFDEMMNMYDHYVVTNARIVVTFTNYDDSNRQTVCVAAVDDSTTYIDIRRLIENGNCAFADLDISPTSNAQKSLTLSVNPLKYQGRKGSLSDPELKGGPASNPTELITFQIYAEPHTVVDSAAVGANVTIYYDVVFIERKKTNIS